MPKLKTEEFNGLKKKIEELTKVQGGAKYGSGAVDIDEVLQICLQNYRYIIGITQEYLEDIFTACDVFLNLLQLDENKQIDVDEFLLLSKCLEPAKLTNDKALKIFNQLSDKQMTNEGVLIQ